MYCKDDSASKQVVPFVAINLIIDFGHLELTPGPSLKKLTMSHIFLLDTGED